MRRIRQYPCRKTGMMPFPIYPARAGRKNLRNSVTVVSEQGKSSYKEHISRVTRAEVWKEKLAHVFEHQDSHNLP